MDGKVKFICKACDRLASVTRPHRARNGSYPEQIIFLTGKLPCRWPGRFNLEE